ncbi:hypothetical protein [Enterococcus sp. AZ179]
MRKITFMIACFVTLMLGCNSVQSYANEIGTNIEDIEYVKDDNIRSNINWNQESVEVIYNRDFSKIEGIRLSSSSITQPKVTLTINGKTLGEKEVSKSSDGSTLIRILDYQDSFAEATDSIQISQNEDWFPGMYSIIYEKKSTETGQIVLSTTSIKGWSVLSNKLYTVQPIMDLNTQKYFIKAQSIEQTPGTFDFNFNVLEESSGKTVTSNSGSSQLNFNIEFTGDTKSSYLVTANFKDHLWGSTATAQIRIHDIDIN